MEKKSLYRTSHITCNGMNMNERTNETKNRIATFAFIYYINRTFIPSAENGFLTISLSTSSVSQPLATLAILSVQIVKLHVHSLKLKCAVTMCEGRGQGGRWSEWKKKCECERIVKLLIHTEDTHKIYLCFENVCQRTVCFNKINDAGACSNSTSINTSSLEYFKLFLCHKDYADQQMQAV